MDKVTDDIVNKAENEELQKEVDYLVKHLGDPKWRMNNLYYVRNEKGQKVVFKMNKVQEEIYDNIWYMNVHPKARQLGLTTFYSIFYLDQVLFSKNKVAGIIAHRQEDMKRIFRGKVLFAWNNLHPWLKEYFGEPVVDTANELVWPNGGGIFVSMTTRSQTPNFLHVSEYGWICANAPDRAQEIRSGALNSVHAGQMISIESTAHGRDNHFYKIVMNAKQAEDEGKELTSLDFRLQFFPWWRDERYRMPFREKPVFTREFEEYFQKLYEKHQIELDDEQKLWYVKKHAQNEGEMYSEFPSTLDEAFSVSLEGAYYKKEMEKVYKEGRVGFYPYDPRYPVDTVWDLGMNDLMVVLFYQNIGAEIRFIDCYSNQGEGLNHYVTKLRERQYRYGQHILPWDSAMRDLSAEGGSREQILWELGLKNTRVAPKLSPQDGIEKTRLIFPRFRFDEKNTAPLVDALQSYRKDWDKNAGVWKNTPRHDQASHWADAVRHLALVWNEAEHTDYDGSDVKITSFF